MDSYYNEEDGIAWGPLTLPEIKKHLELKRKKSKRRKTIHSIALKGSKGAGESGSSLETSQNSESCEQGDVRDEDTNLLEHQESALPIAEYSSAEDDDGGICTDKEINLHLNISTITLSSDDEFEDADDEVEESFEAIKQSLVTSVGTAENSKTSIVVLSSDEEDTKEKSLDVKQSSGRKSIVSPTRKTLKPMQLTPYPTSKVRTCSKEYSFDFTEDADYANIDPSDEYKETKRSLSRSRYSQIDEETSAKQGIQTQAATDHLEERAKIRTLNLGNENSPQPPVAQFISSDDIENQTTVYEEYEDEDKENKSTVDDLDDTFNDMQNFLHSQNDNNSEKDRSFDTITSTAQSKIPVFKLPQRPVKAKKYLSPAKDKFKNVVSPVRLYIKNSPTAPLKTKVTPRVLNKKEFIRRAWEIPFTELRRTKPFRELKQVVYKPSTVVHESTEGRLIIPNNIKSLIKETTVVKHVARLRAHGDTSISEMLENLDLSHVRDEKENVSIHIVQSGLNYN